MRGGGGTDRGKEKVGQNRRAAVTSETDGDKCHHRVQRFPVPPQTNGGATCLEVQQRSIYVQNVATPVLLIPGGEKYGAPKHNWAGFKHKAGAHTVGVPPVCQRQCAPTRERSVSELQGVLTAFT